MTTTATAYTHAHTRVRPFRPFICSSQTDKQKIFCLFIGTTTTIVLAMLAAAELGDADKPETAAVKAMRARDIDNPEQLLQYAQPARIIGACKRFDRLRAGGKNIGPSYLAKMIRNGGVDPEDAPAQPKDLQTALRERFEHETKAFPFGAVTESHAAMQARRWSDEKPCAGQMIVVGATYPNLSVECSECEATASYPLRALAGLPKPSEGQRIGLAIPGVGTPLLSGSAAIPDRHSAQSDTPTPPLDQTPFAATELPQDQAERELATFLMMFNLAADTEEEDQERWAYQKMAQAHARLGGPDLWAAMKWAASLGRQSLPTLEGRPGGLHHLRLDDTFPTLSEQRLRTIEEGERT